MCRRCGCPGTRRMLLGNGQHCWFQSTGDRGGVYPKSTASARPGGFGSEPNRAGEQNMSSRVILITGANGGLGQAIARSFLTEAAENILWLGVHKRREQAETLVSKFS